MKVQTLVVLTTALFMLAGCATLDALKEKLPLKTGDSAESTAQGGAQEKPKKKSMFDYAVPDSYEEAYRYRTDNADKRAIALLKDKSIDTLRTSDPYSYVKKMCDGINAVATNDFEKVKLAHDVVCLLISYDAKSFWAGILPSQEYMDVLQSKTSVCEGYANVFKAFCDTLKIRCEKVHGYARGVGTSLTNEPDPTQSNHAWNLVKIADAWYLVDCTWDSGHMEGKVSKQDYNTDWLFLKPEHFIYTHFPEIARQQLLASPLSAAQFSAQPDLRPKFFEVTSAYTPLAKTNTADSSYSYAYTPATGYELSFRIADATTGQDAQNCSFIKQGSAGAEALFSLPKPGMYRVQIFWCKAGAKSSSSCGEFLINASAGSDIRYPQTFASKAEGVQIIAPLTMPLAKGKSCHFELRVANRKYAAVICGKEFFQLTNDGNGLFTGDVQIPANVKEVTLSVSNNEKSGWEGLAKYAVK